MATFTMEQRVKLAEKKEAMPDGSFPIRNASDLKNAIQAFGRAKDKEATKAWIIKRAKELELSDLLPESWGEEDSITHHGILGMKWGVRRQVGPDGLVKKSGKASSPDEQIKSQRRQDVKNRRQLSDKELIDKIGRLEREKKLRDLTESEIDEGKKMTKDALKQAGMKVATTVIAGAALYGIKSAISGKVDVSDLAGFVSRGGAGKK